MNVDVQHSSIFRSFDKSTVFVKSKHSPSRLCLDSPRVKALFDAIPQYVSIIDNCTPSFTN